MHKPTGTAMSWERVGEEVERRITYIGATYESISRRAGIHPSSLWKIRNGQGDKVTVKLRRKVDSALQWPKGTIDNIYAGAEAPTDLLTDTARLDLLESQVAQLLENQALYAEKLERLARSVEGR